MRQKLILISTSSREQMVNITQNIKEFVFETNVQNGRITVFVPHTTAAVTINENADSTVQKDMLFSLSKISPIYSQFQHLEGNSDAHIKSSIIGCSQDILIENNKLVLGIWQGIYFCEFDGPRQRKIILRIEKYE